MAEGRWGYRLDAPDENGNIRGYTITNPNGSDAGYVDAGIGTESVENIEYRAACDVATRNKEQLPARPRPPAEVRGKRV